MINELNDDPKLTAYALDELADEERAEVEARLATDEAARAQVQSIRALGGQLSEELRLEGASQPIPLHRRSRWAGRAALAAAACLVVGGGAWVALAPRLNRAREVASNRTIAHHPSFAQTTAAQDAAASRERSSARLSSPPAVAERKIPYDDIVQFPTNWPEISSRHDGGETGAKPSVTPPRSPGSSAPVAPPASPAPALSPAPVASRLSIESPSVAAPSSSLGTSLRERKDKAAKGASQAWDANSTADASAPARVEGNDIVTGNVTGGQRFRGNVAAIQGKAQTTVEFSGGRVEQRLVRPLDVREQHGHFNTESYDRVVDNPFMDVVQNPLSTFSIDVDTASYSNLRRFLTNGQRVPKDSVRIEEMLNYFPYDYSPPDRHDEKPFAAHVEVAECPWRPSHRLVRVALKGKEIAADKRPASNLVFLLDVSGSMQPQNKLPLVKKGMRMLVEQLGGEDRVAIVVYAGNSGLVLPSTECSDKRSILNALDNLEAGGSTNGGQGIELAYSTAQANFIKGGTNRVILCTDGDFNVGVTDQGSLTRLIEDKAKSGVFLSVLGFGMGNLKDSTMEKLADKGNGNYGYIDTLSEAKKLLVDQLSGTLVTIVKDVKIQIEFNPAVAKSYRLIGYENRMLAKEDFNDDRKDAGEIGAGHAVTALYEVVPNGAEEGAAVTQEEATRRQEVSRIADEIAAIEGALKRLPADAPQRERDLLESMLKDRKTNRERAARATSRPAVDALKYQKPPELVPTHGNAELLTLKLRYKQPDGDVSKLMEVPVTDERKSFAAASTDFKFAAAVAGFGMMLRESPNKGATTYDSLLGWAEDGLGKDDNGYRHEFIELVNKARTMDGR
jgi:Ca-activated chloride channel family protein